MALSADSYENMNRNVVRCIVWIPILLPQLIWNIKIFPHSLQIQTLSSCTNIWVKYILQQMNLWKKERRKKTIRRLYNKARGQKKAKNCPMMARVCNSVYWWCSYLLWRMEMLDILWLTMECINKFNMNINPPFIHVTFIAIVPGRTQGRPKCALEDQLFSYFLTFFFLQC